MNDGRLPPLTAGELVILGRQLTKIGVAAMRTQRGQRGQRAERAERGEGREDAVPAGLSMVGADVFAHPATSISEIADRTGLRQSYVSESVARLRDQGVVQTGPDPDDGRRTLVRLAAGHPHQLASAAAAPVGIALAKALGGTDSATLTEVITVLTELAHRLKPAAPDPSARYLINEEET